MLYNHAIYLVDLFSYSVAQLSKIQHRTATDLKDFILETISFREATMVQTLEAFINKQGKILLLEPVHLKVNRRALVMILDEEPVFADNQNDSPPKPKGKGRYRSGRSDVSQNAEILLRDKIGKKKCH